MSKMTSELEELVLRGSQAVHQVGRDHGGSFQKNGSELRSLEPGPTQWGVVPLRARTVARDFSFFKVNLPERKRPAEERGSGQAQSAWISL